MFDLENLNILNLSEPADNPSKSDCFNENSFDEYRAALNDAKSFLHRVIIVSKARLIQSSDLQPRALIQLYVDLINYLKFRSIS